MIIYFNLKIIIEIKSFLIIMKGIYDSSSLQRGNKHEKQAFDMVFHKQNQIIQTFLEKINSIYLKCQQLEIDQGTLAQKVAKIQESTSDIHHQFRTTHLLMDKKINHLNNNYHQIKNSNQDVSSINMNDSSKVTPKQSKFKGRKKETSFIKSNRTNKQMISVKFYQSDQDSHQQQNMTLSRQNSRSKLSSNKIQKSLTSVKFASQKFDSIKQPSSTKNKNKFNFVGNENEIKEAYEAQYSTRKQVNNKSEEQSQEQSQKIFQEKVQNMVNRFVDKYIKESEQIRTNITEKFMHFSVGLQNRIQGKLKNQISTQIKYIVQETQKSNNKNKKLIQNLPETIQAMKKQNTQFLNKQSLKMSQELQNIKKFISEKLDHVDLNQSLQTFKETVYKNIGRIQQKIDSKVQDKYFEDSMNNFSASISSQITKIYNLIPNRVQIFKSFMNLDKKINNLIENFRTEQKQIKVVKKQDDGPLRISRCQSQKLKDTAYVRHINDINFDDFDKNFYRSADNSFINRATDINYPNSQAQRPKCLINWRKSNPFNEQTGKQHEKSQKRLKKTSHCKNSVSYLPSSSAKDNQMSSKQWKEKVVRILKTGDRKRMKVTFR